MAASKTVCKLCAQKMDSSPSSDDKSMHIYEQNNVLLIIYRLFDIKLIQLELLQLVCKDCLETLMPIAAFMVRVNSAQAKLAQIQKQSEEISNCADPLFICHDLVSVSIKSEPTNNGIVDDNFINEGILQEDNYHALFNSTITNLSELPQESAISESIKAEPVSNSIVNDNCINEGILQEDNNHALFNSTITNLSELTQESAIQQKPVETKNKHSNQYSCAFCNEKFKQLRNYRLHMQKIHQSSAEIEHKCLECQKSFKSQWNLHRHLQQVHSNKTPRWQPKVVPCTHCEKKFKSEALLQHHIKFMHLDLRPILCDVCGAAVRSNADLKEHMLVHTDQTPFQCDICKKSFKNESRLKNHMETHDFKKYSCAECGLKLNSKVTLNRHMLVHSDRLAHKCDSCGKAFKRSSALKNHLLVHTGLKLFACDFCDRSFSLSTNCRSHKKKAHPEQLAAQEAAGEAAYPKRDIPTLKALKAITKSSNNLIPVVTKSSGNFSKPKMSVNMELCG